MSVFKTILATVLVVASTALPARALDDLTRVFAHCAGRYSAEMEHAWLMQSDLAEDREMRREAFITLLEAVAPVGAGREILHHRISAKVAQSALLTRAAFGRDEAQRQTSAKLAEAHLRICRGYLLQG